MIRPFIIAECKIIRIFYEPDAENPAFHGKRIIQVQNFLIVTFFGHLECADLESEFVELHNLPPLDYCHRFVLSYLEGRLRAFL
jgi:hypothetical protein